MAKTHYSRTDTTLRPQEFPVNADEKTKYDITMRNFRDLYGRINDLNKKINDLLNREA